MFNEVSFIGHLGKEPDIQVTQKQETVVKLSVGSSVWDKYNPYTIWFTVTLWGRSAEYARKNLHKGDMVHVVGTILADKTTGNPRIYHRKDGTVGTSYEVNGRLITRIVKKATGGSGYQDEDEDENLF